MAFSWTGRPAPWASGKRTWIQTNPSPPKLQYRFTFQTVYRSRLQIVPSKRYVFMALSNLDFMNVDETSQWALETLGGVSNRRREVSTEPYHPHSQALKDLVGTYIQGIPEEFHEITFQHGQLYIFYPKYFTEPCPLVPVGSDVFHFQPSFLQESLLLTVLRDDNHEVWAIDLLPGIYVKEGYDSWAAPRDLLDAN